jgi:uncharacterized protein (TIGR02284 family)
MQGCAGFRDFPRLAGDQGESHRSHRTLPTLTALHPFCWSNPMSHPSLELLNTEAALHSVIEVLIDGQEVLRKIGEELKHEPAKLHLLAESLKRAEFRGELETLLHQEGVRDIEESGTPEGTVYRIWAEVKGKLGGGDHTLLVTAEQCEDSARELYAKALQNEPAIPFPIRQLLASQAAHIERSHAYIKAARDEASRAT